MTDRPMRFTIRHRHHFGSSGIVPVRRARPISRAEMLRIAGGAR